MTFGEPRYAGLNPLKTGPSSRPKRTSSVVEVFDSLNPLKTGPSSRRIFWLNLLRRPRVSIPSKRGLHPDLLTTLHRAWMFKVSIPSKRGLHPDKDQRGPVPASGALGDGSLSDRILLAAYLLKKVFYEFKASSVTICPSWVYSAVGPPRPRVEGYASQFCSFGFAPCVTLYDFHFFEVFHDPIPFAANSTRRRTKKANRKYGLSLEILQRMTETYSRPVMRGSGQNRRLGKWKTRSR